MTTYAFTKPEIDWSTFPESDGEPMAENPANMWQMIDLMFSLKVWLNMQARTRWWVGGNQFLYYNERNGRDHASPDIFVAFDVKPSRHGSWKTWVEGKSPDIVWEITSPSTQKEDVGEKRELYARLNVREYYIFDPQERLKPSFRGYALHGGNFDPLPMLPNGGITSALLGAELRPMPMVATDLKPAATYIRVIDPATGDPVIIPEETYDSYDDALGRLKEMGRDVAETRRVALSARKRAVAESKARQEAQRRADAEAQRADAEAQRAAQLEAELRAALAQVALLRGGGTTPTDHNA